MQQFMQLVSYFTIYSFIGWLCESVYCSIYSGKIVNRGFLAGPFCPVYGFGALLVLYFLRPVNAGIAVVFLCGLALTSILEYFTGWLLEVFFGAKWWDYSNHKFNINGRVCLKNSVYFGLMCVFLVKIIDPFVIHIVGLIPNCWMKLSSTVLIAVFAVDSIFTINTLYDLNKRLKGLHEFTEYLKKNADILEWFNEHEFYKSFEKLKVLAEEGKNEINHKIREKFEILTQRRGSGHRLIKAFPNMRSINYDIQLNHLKEVLKELKQKTGKKSKQ